MSNRLSLIIIYFVLTGVVFATAQGYERIIEDFPGASVLSIEEIEAQLYAVVSTGPLPEYVPEFTYQLSLYKINLEPNTSNFQLEESLTIPSPENYSTIICSYIKETKTWLILESAFLEQNKFNYRIKLYDQDFQNIFITEIEAFGIPLSFYLDSYQSNTYILGSILGPPNDELLFVKYDHSFPDSISQFSLDQTDQDPIVGISDMSLDPRSGNMLVFHVNGIDVLDTSLHQISHYGYNDIQTIDHGSIRGHDSFYYSHGCSPNLETGNRKLVVHKYDTLFNIIKRDTLGFDISDNYPFIFKSLDISGNEILIGGHLDGPQTHPNFYNSIKKFYIAKYDNDIRQIWYKEYGGDRRYAIVGLKFLPDGGGLVYGFITDSASYIRHPYIMRVNQEGEILSLNSEQPKASQVQIINSINSNNLSLYNNLSSNLILQIYDINGRFVSSYKSSEINIELNISFLQPGMYFLKVSENLNFPYLIKWVKSSY